MLQEPGLNLSLEGKREFLKKMLLKRVKGSSSQEIAIIGVTGRYPMSGTLEGYWDNLKNGRNCISEIPKERWDWRSHFKPDSTETGEIYTKWGGFINDVDKFDPLFFNISPKEAEFMDPQERLFLETVWTLLEDASITRRNLVEVNNKVGVFVGVMNNSYVRFGGSLAYWSIANRISYFFNFQGPSMAVDTACSSSLTAIHLACDSIRKEECHTAIAGGVNLILHPAQYTNLSAANMLSRDDRCKSFGDGADGFVDGEGVGAVLLKPLEAAIADGDQIYAVIKGSSINAGGKTSGYTVPNPNAQANLILEALKSSKIDPATLSYIEAHGTGTSLGDPIEIAGLTKAFSEYTKNQQFCPIGSVKSNIGHLESAAGIAGLTKILLQMKHKQLVPSIHSEKLNPRINFIDSPFYVIHELTDWKQPVIKQNGREIKCPRRAGISSFGAGGANAHIVLEEYENSLSDSSILNQSSHLIVLSARNEERLKAYAADVAAYLGRLMVDETVSLAQIAYTLQVGREAMEERMAVVVSTIGELHEKLMEFCQGKIDVESLYRGNVKTNKTQVAFLIEGQAGKEFLKAVINERKPAKLAQLWVSGVEIDWRALYIDGVPGRISLPPYPFARNKCWISETSEKYRETNKFHPLIDRVNFGLSLNYEGIVLENKLGCNDLILRDHMVAEQHVFPGVGFLEMAYAAASQFEADACVNLSQVVWLQPLVIQDDKKDVRIFLKKANKGLSYEIQSGDKEGNVIHSKGEVCFHKSLEIAEQKISIEEIKHRCMRQIDTETFYKNAKEAGVSYGPYFQSLVQIWCSDDEALGEIILPPEYDGELASYTLHPSLMDGALQTIGSLAGLKGGRPMLPFSVEEVKVLRPIKSCSYAYAKLVGKDRFHVTVVDKTGSVCVKLQDISLKELKDPLQDFFFIPGWQQVSLPEGHTETGYHQEAVIKTVLIVSPLQCSGIEGVLVEAHSGDNVIEIKLGTETRQHSASSWEVAIGDAIALDNCIQQLNTIHTIYFLGGIQNRQEETTDLSMLEDGQECGVMSLFRLIKSLTRCGFRDQNLRLKVVTNNVHRLIPGDTVWPYSGSLLGLTKSAAGEYSTWQISNIDISLDNYPTKEELHALVKPILDEPGHPGGEEVAIRNDKRYVRTIEPINLPTGEKLPFKKNGVYLILGGAGGIGLELSLYLAETVQAKLALIGRSKLSTSQEETISRIQSKGGEALYIQADAADLDGMRDAVDKAKRRFGQINGVIHSAIVLKDQSLENMDEDSFRSVLAPKVKGSLVLHKVLQGENLDFMIFFSSLQSFASNPGQSNYAAASTFEDSFAHYLDTREAYPVKIINWGYWGTVGVVASEPYNRRLAAVGVRSIKPEEGMETVRRILTHRVNQIIAVKADVPLLEKIGVDLGQQIELLPANFPSVVGTAVENIHTEIIAPSMLDNTRKAFNMLEAFGHYLLLDAFRKMGIFKTGGERYNKKLLKEQLEILPGYSRLYEGLLAIMVRAGYVQFVNQDILTTKEIEGAELNQDLEDLNRKKTELMLAYPDIAPHFNLLWACFEKYPQIIRGEIPAAEIIFPNTSMKMVEGIYKGNKTAEYFNGLVVQSLLSYIKTRLPQLSDNQKIKILEVGAGTGGTSTRAFDAIHAYGNKLQYVYTDISVVFTQYGEKHYSTNNPFVDFRLLNIEKDVRDQGYMPGEFDVVIATNVLHATKSIKNTLHNIKCLLKTNGWLILNEGTCVRDFLTLTFGLLDGWWLYEDMDNRLEGSPLLSTDTWERLLQEDGFYSIPLLGRSEGQWLGQNVIIAESNGIVKQQRQKQGLKHKIVDQQPKLAVTEKRSLEFERPITQKSAVVNDEVLKNYIEESIIKSVITALKVDIRDIDLENQFSEYGVDSITGLELIKNINSILGLKLRTTVTFDYGNIKALTQHIYNKYSGSISANLEFLDGETKAGFNENRELDLLQKVANGELSADEADRLMGVI